MIVATTNPSEIPNATPKSAMEMVKFHASLNVSDLGRSLEFYTALFGVPPVKAYPDYAKFELDVPPLILSLKPKRACAGGPLNHLGLRLLSTGELNAVYDRLVKVGARIGRQDDVKCCYALQTKLWITDPDGTLWEVYVLHDDVHDWGEKHNKIKLWKAPLQAFGVRGMIRRWWNNAFRPTARNAGLSMTAEYDESSPIPADTCSLADPPDASSRGD